MIARGLLAALALAACSTPPALAPTSTPGVVSLGRSCARLHPAVGVELPAALEAYCRAGHSCSRMRWGTGGRVHVQCLNGIKPGEEASARYDADTRTITIWTRAWSSEFGTVQDLVLVTDDSAHCYADTSTTNWTRARRLLEHELGHAHGWEHSCTRDDAEAKRCTKRQRESIMYPYGSCKTKRLELRP